MSTKAMTKVEQDLLMEKLVISAVKVAPSRATRCYINRWIITQRMGPPGLALDAAIKRLLARGVLVNHNTPGCGGRHFTLSLDQPK